ncbi:hypothetical protein COS78_03260 [Candidatus Shapirobacteria bacterium CG06_land_8_20_14_3_00_40_12]|uniref:Glycosyltransferase RgtA/B/C/D-like domain-containing protein n=2 Tax=Candidatus Shapironibacteriota TaxID=1752721 RepID=A0A2M7TT81_9BACT|nr:MAG: hypothetical protein COS78_03260 [Candidatus Shapirobacteria bacterium CG06_land_8_20_14_3_00_40_12]PIZ59261.1 MAG: hypothetical protein COY20_02090 [Candidatus Shapirobacteria bacterium CG_4_10_14_0_2_um_filter_40_12]
MKIKTKIILLLIVLLAFSLRIYGLNWDGGNHLHPDERFLTMVASDIKLPSSISQYFSTATSPLNPGNYPPYQFFVYGTFPLFLTKLLAVIFGLNDYSHLHLVGRILSALFDTGNIIILYLLTKKFLAPFLYTATVLPLQLSHFFAVDTFLTFFIFLTFYLLSQKKYLFGGFTFGLAMSCKISALYFLPIVFLFFLFHKKLPGPWYFILCSFITFRLFQPYAFTSLFTPNPVFIKSLEDLKNLTVPSIYFPPSVQWMSKIKVIFPLQNIIFWGVGIPLFLSPFFLKIKKLKLSYVEILSLIWIIFLLLYQGTQPVYTMRYFLPLYPFLILILSRFSPPKILIVFHFLFCFTFLGIYSHPHSRVQASTWINQNLPAASVLSTEYWDDILPLDNNQRFDIQTLAIASPDTPEKWEKINDQLKEIDYLILSSNRAWASITKVSKLFPETSSFYQGLFSEKPLKEFNSYPGFSLPFLRSCYYFGPTNKPLEKGWFAQDPNCLYPGIYLRDDTAEEAFTVYDHPKVLIFKNEKD